MKNDSLRVGHMANIGESEVIQFLSGLENILHKSNSNIKIGTAVNAAANYIK